MRKAGGLSILFIGIASLMASYHLSRKKELTPPRPSEAEWEEYRYKLLPGPSTETYNAKFTFKVFTPPAKARLLFDLTNPQNYFFVDLSEDRVSIGKVENGLEFILSSAVVALQRSSPTEFVLKHRSWFVELVRSGERILRAYDRSLQPGKLGWGSLNRSAVIRILSIQPIAPIYLSDDFMKASEEGSTGGWRPISGSWRVFTLRNPGLSSNAFFYLGKSGEDSPGLTITGYPFWDTYTVRVSFFSEDDEFVGLVFYCIDEENYCAFRWNSTKRDIVRVRDGKLKILAQDEGGYLSGQWYELRVRVVESDITAFIDGNEVLRASDPTLCFGAVGLYTQCTKEVRFDDFAVAGVKQFRDYFVEHPPGKWLELSGSWEFEQGSYTVNSSEEARAVTGDPRWRDYTVSCEVENWSRGEVGLIFCYLDELNYYVFSIARNKAQLLKVREGTQSKIAEKTLSPPPGSSLSLKVIRYSGIITAFVDGSLVLHEWESDYSHGLSGLYAKGAKGTTFRLFEISLKEEVEPVPTQHEVFAAETTMLSWAGTQSDWSPAYASTPEGKTLLVNWHRADFYGNVELEAILPEEIPTDSRLLLFISAQENKPLSSYLLEVKFGNSPSLTLFRNYKPVAESTPYWTTEPEDVRLSRHSDIIVGCINAEPVLYFKDPEPLSGYKVGWATVRLPIEKQKFSVFSDRVYIYTFARAPAQWRFASGIWEVTNRWQCDPRWSFFSGRSTRLAAMWNKRLFGKNITLEFAAGIKMARERGSRYEYASDLNATICADGNNLDTGYNFIFGGWNNTATRILRNNKVVAQSSYIIPRGIHRRWFYFKIQKRGPELRYWIDGALILKYTDPQPLQGRRVAIWTWNNGIMVARVRISSSEGTVLEFPDSVKTQQTVRCCYNQ